MNPLGHYFELLQLHWSALALGSSLFWGLRGAYLYTFRGHLQKHRPIPGGMNQEFYEGIDDWVLLRLIRFMLWVAYYFIFHFVGSVAGWICLYLAIARIQAAGSTYNSLVLTWSDFGLIAISILGITDHLPEALFGVVMAFSRLAETLINRIAITPSNRT
jgi:hypothetical protein